jgi:DAK2 domain fusion protein YloV
VAVSGDNSRLKRLDARAARRWAMATRAAFAVHRAEIDDLNVFPVPDGDTGTNLYITLDSALEAAREPREPVQGFGPGAGPTLAGDAAALARATLLAARGNSGVILSQLIRGLSEVIGEASSAGVKEDREGGVGGNGDNGDTCDNSGIDGPTLALAVRRASDLAYAGVTRPVEGTILTVASAAAGAAELAAATGSDLYAVAHAALAAARVALAATTAQLPILARTGVVDAGGMGYVLVLEALERVVAGELATDPRPELEERHPVALHPVALRAAAHADHDGGDVGLPEPGGPAYEVMYLLSDSTEEAVSALRERLDALGDSVLVVGGGDIWNVHVHVDDVGAAIQAGIEAGRPHRIVVTHFGDQQRARRMHTAPSDQNTVAVLACAAGDGLAEVFSAAGAVAVFNGPGRRASAGQLLDAIRSAGSRCVLVLPNEVGTQLAAEAAASAAAEAGVEVHVVRSRSAAQGIAALAVFDPGASAQDNLVAMNGAAEATRHGAVTVATKEARTSAGWCHPGDVLGVVGGEVVAIGKDLAVVGAQVVDRLLADGGEMLTVISGAGGGPELSAVVAASAREGRHDLEFSIIEGGQATYPLLLGVE